MSGTIFSAVGAVAGALAMLLVYLVSRKHKEHIEDQEQETNHVTAISSASETLAEAVNMLIAPLNASIIRLQEQEREMAIEMTKMKAELAVVKSDHRRLNRDMKELIKYVRRLWGQIHLAGVEPLAPPEELAHVAWDDDEDG